MPNYRRAWNQGGTWFFTVNALERYGNDVLIRHIDALRQAVREVRRVHPFKIHGWVVLPEHIHAILELPPDDTDFALRWRLIRMGISRRVPKAEWRSAVRIARGERGVWQRRYWEHLIRDEADFQAHMDYLHFNPVKHGWVTSVKEWPYPTFHQLLAQGVYTEDWGGRAEGIVVDGDE